jgi:hypothetical protein
MKKMAKLSTFFTALCTYIWRQHIDWALKSVGKAWSYEDTNNLIHMKKFSKLSSSILVIMYCVPYLFVDMDITEWAGIIREAKALQGLWSQRERKNMDIEPAKQGVCKFPF